MKVKLKGKKFKVSIEISEVLLWRLLVLVIALHGGVPLLAVLPISAKH